MDAVSTNRTSLWAAGSAINKFEVLVEKIISSDDAIEVKEESLNDLSKYLRAKFAAKTANVHNTIPETTEKELREIASELKALGIKDEGEAHRTLITLAFIDRLAQLVTDSEKQEILKQLTETETKLKTEHTALAQSAKDLDDKAELLKLQAKIDSVDILRTAINRDPAKLTQKIESLVNNNSRSYKHLANIFQYLLNENSVAIKLISADVKQEEYLKKLFQLLLYDYNQRISGLPVDNLAYGSSNTAHLLRAEASLQAQIDADPKANNKLVEEYRLVLALRPGLIPRTNSIPFAVSPKKSLFGATVKPVIPVAAPVRVDKASGDLDEIVVGE